MLLVIFCFIRYSFYVVDHIQLVYDMTQVFYEVLGLCCWSHSISLWHDSSVYYKVFILCWWSYLIGLWHDSGVLFGFHSMLLVIFNRFMTWLKCVLLGIQSMLLFIFNWLKAWLRRFIKYSVNAVGHIQLVYGMTLVFHYVFILCCWSYANGLWHDAGVLLGIQCLMLVIFNWLMTWQDSNVLFGILSIMLFAFEQYFI